MAAAGPITTHALNTATGRPAEGLQVSLKKKEGEDATGQSTWKILKVARTNSDGRVPGLAEGLQLLPGEVFELAFDTSEYFKGQGTPCFYPFVRIVFEIQEAESHYHAKMLVVDPKARGRVTEVVRAPSVQVFVASLKTSAVIVASIVQELEDPQKSKGIDVNTAAVDELIAELAAKSPKRAEAAQNLPKGSGQVRSSLAAKADKQVVEDDSLALSLTSSDLGTAVLGSKDRTRKGSGEVSFNLTATDALQVSKKVPVLNQGTQEVVKAVSQKFDQRSGGLGVSHDNHALRDVLGDALDLGGHTLNLKSTGHLKSRPQAEFAGAQPWCSGSLPMHGTRDLAEAVLLDAMDAEVSARSGPLQSSGTVVAEGEAGSVHFDHVTPGWKVKSSSRRHSDSSSSSPPASREKRLPIVTRDQPAHVEVPKRDTRAPSLRAAGAGAVLGSQPLRTSNSVPTDVSSKRRPSRGSSSRGSQGNDNDRSVTWPQMPPIEILVPQPSRESRARLRSTTPPAGRPTTPDSARKARVEKDQKKELQRNGAMTIPFHDGPKGSAPQPPKGLLERMEQRREQLQVKKAERIKDIQEPSFLLSKRLADTDCAGCYRPAARNCEGWAWLDAG
ncbi:urah, partial [Symbiodinium natans]